MVYQKVKCPFCGSEDVSLFGKTKKGTQRYICNHDECSHKTFQLEYKYNACKPGAHERIIEMAMNGSGTRDTGRALRISKDTVTAVLKKTEKFVVPVNQKFLDEHKTVDIEIHNALATEMDEMWSFCGNKKHEIWLWRAVDHTTNTPLAFVFGTRKHKYLKELLALLKPFHIGKVYADGNFAYSDNIPMDKLIVGKKNTQKIERNHLTLRTRIKRLCRKTICFSKRADIHKAVIGTFINIFFFGRHFDVSMIL